MTTVPFIPDNAPFTPEQRAWLNGFLAGLFSNAPANAQAAPPAVEPLKVAVLFATQSGTAERLAKKVAKELKGKGHTVELASLDKFSPAALAEQEHAVILASTYGEGDPPDGSKTFAEQIFAPDAPRLDRLRYSVFALGDRTYEHFCKFGADLDERLRALGASPIAARVESDVEVDEPFEQWKSDLLARLALKEEKQLTEQGEQTRAHIHDVRLPAPATGAAPANGVTKYTRDNPYLAEVRSRDALTGGESSKLTVHFAFALEDPALTYEVGDACGLIPTNDPALVADLLALLPFSGSTPVELPKLGMVPFEQALTHYLQPTRLTRKMVQAFAAKADCKTLTGLLLPEQATHLEAYTYDRGLIDLLHEYPGLFTDPAEVAAMLPRLSPRLYSISSSPAAHGREVHTTVAVVRYRSHDRERGGICSTMLADRVDLGSRLPIYIQPNKKFRLPADGSTPILMIGPGTGVAPFRAFLHERRALGARGKNWLFFGDRSARTDFLYCEELRGMTEDGHITRLDTAFSRDQAHKVYVQDRMIEHGAEFWSWLNEGAVMYVCGDATRMAKDVDAALHSLIGKYGAMSADAAKDYVATMHDENRYHRDVY